jgi:rhodanese-related sulfurtransferase
MSTQTQKKFQVITRDELKAKIDRKEKFHLWNTVTPEYYHADRNIPGSQWVPANELPKRLPALNVGKNEEIVTYCSSFTCPASKQAAEILIGQGYTNVKAFEGGLADWQEGGNSFVTL